VNTDKKVQSKFLKNKMQQRLRRFVRQPEKLEGRQITDKGMGAVATIERYRFLPTSLLVRLMPGDQKNNHRHLQTLFHRGLVNRFCLPKYGGPGEFIYYLDSASSLATLKDAGLLPVMTDHQLRRREEIVRNNREHDYSKIHRNIDAQGKVLYIQHELMVSRFHAMLELACRHSRFSGKVFLEQWKQGPELWNRVEVPTFREEPGFVEEQGDTEFLPHRPDAFFTLYFPGRPEGKERSHFLYEADRGTENTTRFKMKLRAHFHYIVKQQRQRTDPCYNVRGIRAVLTETTGMQWAHNLREAARRRVVSPKPSPLFWFTTSEILTKPEVHDGRQVPRYLMAPEAVFERIWANPVEDKFLNLLE
jgi:hypothetical protein